MTAWTHKDSEALYNVPQWSGGYFGINAEGHVVARPDARPREERPDGIPSSEIDLHTLIGQIRRRGVETPILLRFDGILRARVREIFSAFDRAREEYGFQAPYGCVFPIKVNQQRHLVDVLAKEGTGLGLEVGSKPELLAVLGLYASEQRLIICNGYKDSDYVETALLGSRLGCVPILVIEKFSEVETILHASKNLGIRPVLGVRTKLGITGAGRWKESGGDRSKFGLTARQVVLLVDALEREGMLDCLQLLHFHLGSQVTNIRAIKVALGEATRTLTGLHAMGAPIRWFDVGGGLGIDYDGSSTDFDSSINYSLQEYANDVVYQLKSACQQAGIPEPMILSESGRALTAHHAVLITEVIGVSGAKIRTEPLHSPTPPGEERKNAATELIREFEEVYREISVENFQESYHDALELRERVMTLFRVGQVDLRARAVAEEFFWLACERILEITAELDYVPEDLEHLERDMADTYFLNFSVFQSLPDSWAIKQLFPVLPIHRLNQRPDRHGVLADITCDSDGKVDRFIALRGVKRTLELHPLGQERYYVGFFLVGAYQEILGDLHNLFGDTHVVHVEAGESGKPRLSHFVPGDRVDEVLSYVEYFQSDLMSGMRRQLERAIEEDRINLDDSALLLRRFETGLASYTYLCTPDPLEGHRKP